jgi:hypothetical protein
VPAPADEDDADVVVGLGTLERLAELGQQPPS